MLTRCDRVTRQYLVVWSSIVVVAQCVLVLVVSLHVAARYALQLQRADAAGPLAYYTHLLFDVSSFQLIFDQLNCAYEIRLDLYVFLFLVLNLLELKFAQAIKLFEITPRKLIYYSKRHYRRLRTIRIWVWVRSALWLGVCSCCRVWCWWWRRWWWAGRWCGRARRCLCRRWCCCCSCATCCTACTCACATTASTRSSPTTWARSAYSAAFRAPTLHCNRIFSPAYFRSLMRLKRYLIVRITQAEWHLSFWAFRWWSFSLVVGIRWR